eukprot:TRINITY_DN65782_c0_g1_i1.p1 TRINITY_DN65782_c0_g1~~TRINITY_DN65782_c0_g1_i1.p1  ORF type:complete len:301 (+),score=47.47 TRINITY_DN65782_c0_g1_i1:129-1031(+)
MLAGCAATIEFISFVGCLSLSTQDFWNTFERVQCFERLHTLVLGSCRVDDIICNLIGDDCPALKTLDLWNCCNVTDRGVQGLLENPLGTGLSQLNLRECHRVSGRALNHLHLRQNQQLLTLDAACIGDIQDEDLLPLLGSQACQSLASLSLGGAGCRITDVVLHVLPVSLTTLDLSLCGELRSFELIARRLPKLSSLSLQGCQVQGTQITTICWACPLHSLNVGHTDADDTVLEKVAAACRRRLLDLDLSGCSEMTDAAVESLVVHCNSLVRLGLAGCPQVTRETCLNVRQVLPACDVSW